MERKIGEIFEYKGKTYKVVESKLNLCSHCSFGEVCGGRTMIVTGNCISTNRFDKKNVIFKEVKNMEKEINIAEILKDKPQGIRLYSPIFGECAFCSVQNITDSISVKKHNGEEELFNSKGLYCTLGEVMLYPSKGMRDWSKITWKKGDVLVSNDDDIHIIFNGFSKDDYTTFEGEHYVSLSERRYISYLSMQKTQGYHIEYDKDAAQTYINTIEKKMGGKLNRETLEIEKAQTDFKDGDIVAVDLERKNIRIFKEKENENNFCRGKYYIGFSFNDEGKLIQTFENYRADCTSDRLATEEEKQQLFDALAKGNKAWDAEKKIIVDLKHKIGFKPFDKVIVFDETKKEWKCDIFSNKTKDANGDVCALCIGGVYYNILPYEGNESLLGTTKDVED